MQFKLHHLILLAAVLVSAGCAHVGDGPAAGTNVWSDRMEAKRVALVSATADSGIAVLKTDKNELQANVPSDFSFDSDSANLTPRMKAVLDRFAADLERTEFARMQIRVVGHTDSRGSDAANDTLSLDRAGAVAHYLHSRGISPKRIRVEGRGEREPQVGNDIPMARALNRRVEMFLSEPGG